MVIRLNLAGRALLSFFCFNFGWWACALGPSYGYPWAGALALPLFVAPALLTSPTPRGDALFYVCLAGAGFAIDSALLHVGLFRVGTSLFAPAWLIGMWVLLGLTFENMLPLRRHWALLALAGVLSGPLSYIFAEAVGILVYAEPRWVSLAAHGIFWAGLLPLLFLLRDRCLHLTRRAEWKAVRSGSAAEPPAPEAAAPADAGDRKSAYPESGR